jgi:hypothetical protein
MGGDGSKGGVRIFPAPPRPYGIHGSCVECGDIVRYCVLTRNIPEPIGLKTECSTSLYHMLMFVESR